MTPLTEAETTARLAEVVASFGGPGEGAPVIELDRYPGERDDAGERDDDGDVDGRRADEAAALWENRYEAQAGWAS